MMIIENISNLFCKWTEMSPAYMVAFQLLLSANIHQPSEHKNLGKWNWYWGIVNIILLVREPIGDSFFDFELVIGWIRCNYIIHLKLISQLPLSNMDFVITAIGEISRFFSVKVSSEKWTALAETIGQV